MVKKNWFFLLAFAAMLLVFIKRYNYLEASVVSNPDSQIVFNVQDGTLEQTWQPEVNMLAGVRIPYLVEDGFSGDVQLKIFSDDYSEKIVEVTQTGRIFAEGESGKIEFLFDRTGIIRGERYRIQFAILNASEEGSLSIASGSNYGGCTVDGEVVEQGVALTFTVVKYSKLFWLMAVLLPLLSGGLFMIVTTGRKWEETVGFALLLEGLMLYVFGLMGYLLVGLCIVYMLSVLALLAVVFIYNKKNQELKNFFSPGLWIYFFFFCVILITSNGDWLGNRDELRHWGIAVRDMFYYDAFANHVDTTVILTRYLPFTAVLEYVFEYMNGMFSEDILLIAYQTMLLSMSIILYKPLQKKWKKLLFPLTALSVCVPVIFFSNLSSTIMVDSFLAFLAIYALICFYTDKMSWFNMIRIACALLAMVLTKDMGLILGGIVSLIMFGDILMSQVRKKQFSIKQLLYPVICVVLIMVSYIGWQIYLGSPAKDYTRESYKTRNTTSAVESLGEISTADTMAEKNELEIVMESDGAGKVAVVSAKGKVTETALSASGITVSGVLNVLTGGGESYQYQITHNFITELFEGEIYTYRMGIFNISFVKLLALLAFLIVSLGYFGYWKENKGRMYAWVGGMVIGAVVLCIFLQLTYWFTFSMYEGMALTSLDRYLAPFACAVVVVSFYLIIDGLQYQSNDYKTASYLVGVLSFLMVFCMPVRDLVTESKDRVDSTVEEVTYGHENIAEILRSVARRGERAYFICSNSDGYSEYIFRNTVCPIISLHEEWNIVPSKEVYLEQYELYGEDNIDDNIAVIFSEAQWGEVLVDCQYVVVFHADELFRKSYVNFFEDGNIQDGSVYQVVLSEGNVKLKLIGTTGIKGWH